MNIRKMLLALALSTTVYGQSVMAGDPNQLTLSSENGVVGGQVMIDIDWADSGTLTQTLQFDMFYDNVAFTFDSCPLNNPGDWVLPTCQVIGPGIVRLGLLDPDGLPAAITVGTLILDVNGPAGMYSVDVVPGSIVTSDGEATSVTNSTINVLGPAYASAPIMPGGPFAFGSHTAGDPNPTVSTDVSNIGEPMTSLDVNCGITGPDSAAFVLTSPAMFSVPQGASSQVDVQCDSSMLTPGTYNMATLECAHNGGPPGAASPVTYPLSCTILAAPAPNYSSMPAPGETFDFGQNLTTDPDQDLMLTITNNGNADGLDGLCLITIDAGGVFSIDSNALYGPLAQGASAMRTVTCSTANAGDFVGEMQCSAVDPAANAGSFIYPLNCSVDSIPTYGSDPDPGMPLNMNGVQGNGPATTTLFINNLLGEPGSLLSGSCTLDPMGDPEISLASSGVFTNLPAGNTVGSPIECDDTAVGNYTSTLTCVADAPASNPGPFVYPVNCVIDQPDPATYVSTPYAGGNPGDLIDLNEGNPPPPVNNGVAVSTVLTISNGSPAGDDDLVLDDCEYTGDPEITTSPALLNTTLAPGASTMVTFNCDTDSSAATFTGTYTCPFDENPTPPPPPPAEGGGSGIMSPATYPVQCVVREQFSDVEETPASGTPFTAELMPGESTTFSVTFDEILDEGLDGEIDCSVSGPDFAITAGGPGATTVPAGGSVQVDATFTDPGVGDTFNDTLTCIITDNPDGGEPETETVSWPLEVTVIGRNATFIVTKDFDDDNPLGVEVTLECNTGLPLMQTGTVHDPDAPGLTPGDFTELRFLVVDFDPGAMNCDVYETVPTGYAGFYAADFGMNGVANNVFDDEEGCHYEGIESADFTCELSNQLQASTLTVNKEWIDDNPGFNLPLWVEVLVVCENVQDIEEGPGCPFDGGGTGTVCFEGFIDPSNPGVYDVLPHWDGTTVCSVTETPEAGVDQDVSDCASIPLAPGVDGECTIVNTRLYEGIPTLSQYGLLLMALMMLGVGLVGFRRYS